MLLNPNLPLLGDGGISTSLQALGLAPEALPEAWNLAHPERVSSMHRAFAAAGAEWTTANTFGANRPRLARFGLEKKLAEICGAAVRCAREGAPDLPVLGSIGPVPLEAEAFPLYLETVEALAAAGVDGLLVETLVSLPHALAALRAAAEVGAGYLVASVTPGEAGDLLDGTPLETAARELFRAGAAVVGVNCGAGPEGMLEPVRRLVRLQEGPVLAAPNAGLPYPGAGGLVYSLQSDSFGRAAIQFVEAGASLVAGCCGVAPEHIRAASLALRARTPK